MKSTSGAVSLVLVLMAASSLISMISLLRIDSIVHGDLYRHGLNFSPEWALPYWTMSTVVFGMGWFNILVAIAFQFYVLIYRKKETSSQEAQIPSPIVLQPQPTKEETSQTEATPIERVEEYTEHETKPREEVEKEPEPEQTQTVTETPSQPEQTETQEKSEETPNIAEVPEEENPQTATEDAQEQGAPSQTGQV